MQVKPVPSRPHESALRTKWGPLYQARPLAPTFKLLPGNVLSGLRAQGYRCRTGEQPREPPRPPAPALPAGSSGMREGLVSAT